MTKDTNTPQPAGSLRGILHRLMKYSNPITQPDMLDEAEAAIAALIEGAAPAKAPLEAYTRGPGNTTIVDNRSHYCDGRNDAIDEYRANLLRALNGKEQDNE